MCGIAGRIRFDGQPAARDEIERMTRALAHRGPDGEGLFTREGVALGHRRLAIIDLVSGDQPMHSGDLSIVFNGEIYNYRELAAELTAQGCVFNTRSDTEVILHAYAKWGDDCVKRFRGMFAFCLVDFANRRWLLARDHFGIKPLYYRLTRDGVAFGSELPALRALDGVKLRGRMQAVEYFLRFQYIPGPDTVFEGVSKLPPAYTLAGSLDGKVGEPRAFWGLKFSPAQARSDDEWLDQAQAVIADSVKAHLVADVPVGVFVSGGIDSTLVASQMANLAGGPVSAFSIGFEEPGFSELPYAREAADKLGVTHHTLDIRDDFWDELPNLVAHYGEPYGDNSMIPTWQLAKLTRQHVKVALSGDGGDEGFGGYASYLAWLAKPRVGEYWRRLRRGEGGVGDLWWAMARSWFGGIAVRPAEWTRIVKYTSDDRRRGLWKPDFARLVDAGNPTFDAAAARAPRDLLSFAQFMDFGTYLPGDVLTKVDVASMYHGVEVRTPLIDTRVVEFAATLPPSLRVRGGVGKFVLKKLLERRFSPEFVHRKKQGFGIPRKQWFMPGRAGRKLLEEVLADSALRVWFDPAALDRLLAEHGEKDRSAVLWLLLVLGLWLRQNSEVEFA